MAISKWIRAAGLTSAALLLLLFVTRSDGQGIGTGRIEGLVLRAGTGTPVAGAQVALTRELSPEGIRFGPTGRLLNNDGPAAPIVPVITDEQGHFVFDSLAAGPYRVTAKADGHVAQEYGQRRPEMPGAPVQLAAGQSVEVAIRLQPAGNISGRIRDRDRRPLAGVAVHLLRMTYDSEGHRTLEPIAAVRTNDRGDYRFFWITPGSYYLRAAAFEELVSTESDAFGLAIDSGVFPAGFPNPNEVPAAVEAAYFPGSPDPSGARSIELLAGGDRTGVDWVLLPKRSTYRVRARLVDAKTGKAAAGADINIAPANAEVISPFGQVPARPQSYDASTGIAEFRRLKPGAYTITAVINVYGRFNGAEGPEDAVTPEHLKALQEQAASPQFAGSSTTSLLTPVSVGVASVTVADSDIDEVVVTIAPVGSIHIQVLTEGELPKERYEQMCFQLTSINFNPLAGYATRCAVPSAPILNNIAPGLYRIEAVLPDDVVYIKEARLDGKDVLSNPVEWSGGTGSLDILISVNSGRVRGTVVDDRRDPVQNAEVVLVPDRARHRPELFIEAFTDDKGRFALSGIAPGAYKVFSWESIEPNEWFDPGLIERSESRGSAVIVTESSAATIEVRTISGERSR